MVGKWWLRVETVKARTLGDDHMPFRLFLEAVL